MSSRLLPLIIVAGCVWVAVEVYTEGTSGAFGGALAGIGSGDARSQTVSPLERIRSSAGGSRDRQLGRIERQLEGPSVGLNDKRKGQPAK